MAMAFMIVERKVTWKPAIQQACERSGVSAERRKYWKFFIGRPQGLPARQSCVAGVFKQAIRCGRRQSQRDCGLQPKVGAAPTLGSRSGKESNLNEVVAGGARLKTDWRPSAKIRNRVAVEICCGR
jgi:hypothetical protein